MLKFISQKKFLVTNLALSSFILVYSAYGMDKLYKAIKSKDIKTVTELLKDKNIKDSINQPDKEGDTPLFWTIVWDNKLEMVKLLLENGAKDSVNIVDQAGFTPVFRAVLNLDLDVLKLLLENGAKSTINIAWGDQTPLYIAVLRENLAMVKLLLFFGAQVTDEIKKLNPKDDTIIKLLKNPTALELYLTKEELDEFDKIAGKSKPDFMKFKEQYDINIKYRSKDYPKKEEMVKEIFGMKNSKEKTKRLIELNIIMKEDKELEEIVKRNREEYIKSIVL